MSDIESILKSIALGSVGAVATVVEKGGELARSLVEKGETTVNENRETVDAFKAKAQEWSDQVMKLGREAARLTKDQRDALRKMLDALDEEEAAQDAPAAEPAEAPAEAVEAETAEAEASAAAADDGEEANG